MKKAFQTSHAFITEVREVLARGGSRFWWLGQSGFLFCYGGKMVAFDPYLSDSLTRKYAGTDKPHTRITELVVEPMALASVGHLSLVTCSHVHTDHLDAETLRPLLSKNPESRLLAPASIRETVRARVGAELAGRIVDMDAVQGVTLDGIEFRGIPAAHNEVERDSNGRCMYLGYVMRWGGKVVYHSGDTLWHSELAPALSNLNIDVALLPINGNRPERRVAGNLNGVEAAQLANAIGAKVVVPCHYDLFEFNTASPDSFIEECRRLKQPYKVLQNGEGTEW